MRQVPTNLPGSELVVQGIKDLHARKVTIESLLVSIGAPRLRLGGLKIQRPFKNPEHRLYFLLCPTEGDNAHSVYNAYVRRLVSFEHALGVES